MKKYIAGFFFLLISIFIYAYPFGRVWIACTSFLYAVILFKRPHLWLFFIPFLMPLIRFAQKSGWFFWDLSDLLVMVTLAVLYYRKPVSFCFPRDKVLKTAFGLITVSMVISLVLGLYPLPEFDYNAFSSYHTQYNSLRVFKGFFWALLLQQFLFSSDEKKHDYSIKLFLSGSAAGLSGVIMAALWERHLFSAIFDLNESFRISSLFASMHIGGGAIEAYLVMTIPLLFSWGLACKKKRVLFLSLIILAGGCYVMTVTYSRAGYLGLLVSVGAAAFFSLGYGYRLKLIRTMGILFFFSVITLFLLTLMMQSGYLKKRFALFEDGYRVRMEHWKNTISLMDRNALHMTAGMGLGSFPRLFRERFEGGRRSGLLRYVKQQNPENSYVKLIHGADFYMDQQIISMDHPPYYLTLDIKAASSDMISLGASICEKNMLYSFNCQKVQISCKGLPGEWQPISIVLENKLIKNFESFLSRPTVFSLYNSTKDIDIEVDNIRLRNGRGEDLIFNGDFSKGYDRWFFVSDDHQVWHIKNLFVQLFFDQGFLGVISFTLFFLTVLIRTVKLYHHQDLLWAGFISSFSGLLITACCVSMFDFPRVTMLFFMNCFIVLKKETRDSPNLVTPPEMSPFTTQTSDR